MNLPCPTCGLPADQSPANPERPFCSQRCRERDLAAWLDEDYRIPVAPGTSDDPEDFLPLPDEN